MKPSIITGAALLVLAVGQVNAACTDPQVTDTTTPNLQTLLSGNTACAMRGSDAWQEEHNADGTLWDYKKRNGDPIDPRKLVGNWAVQGTGASTVVSYSYPNDTGGPYTYAVHDTGDGTHYTFCGADTLEVTLVTGVNVGCGF